MATDALLVAGRQAAALAGDRDVVRRLQRARDALLNSGQKPSSVRDEVQVSWRRSMLSGVAPHAPQTPRLDSLEPGGKLLHAARPILDRIGGTLVDTDFSVLLLDRNGWVLDRRVGSPRLTGRLDANLTVPGYSLAEQFAGTNGPGTALEVNRPIQISGPEHFADRYQDLTCAAVPILHPVTGRLEGAVNLTCPFSQTSALMLPFVAAAVTEIQSNLSATMSHRERMLLQEYLATCQRTSDPVVAISETVLMANAAAARLFDSADHAVLWERAATSTRSHADGESWEWQTSAGEALHMLCRPVLDGTRLVGAIIHGKVHALDRKKIRPDILAAVPLPLPGVVLGRSQAMAEISRSARTIGQAKAACVISGEAGSGKLTLAVAMARLGHDGADPVVLDAAAAHLVGSTEWLRSTVTALDSHAGAVILTHLDALDDVTARTLGACLDARDVWVIATSTDAHADPSSALGALLERLRVTEIEMPPLRTRPEDISLLATSLLERHGQPGQKFRPEALHALSRLDWPGNVRELENIVKRVALTTPALSIDVNALPAAVLTKTSSRRLSPIERAELDAIVQALKDAGGNKVDAARQLGLARSTLYRKLRSYCLDGDHLPF